MNQEVIDNFIKVFEDYELEVVRDGMTGEYFLLIYKENQREKEDRKAFHLKEVLL